MERAVTKHFVIINQEMSTSDHLAEIDGKRPIVYLKDGEEREVTSQTR